jgi:lipopolysaccharide biosynthesis glycosyltransferase
MQKAIFVFTPSQQQQHLLERVLDSIAKHISIDYEFCLFTDTLNGDFKSKYEINIKEISKEDLELLQRVYVKEGRADIPAFSAYAQFLIPRYFSEYQSFLYMEVDQIVRKDLAAFWVDCVSRQLILAAVAFYDHNFYRTAPYSFKRLFGNATCFNTGVLYVDSRTWIDRGFECRCLEEAGRQKLENGTYYDFYAQGAINHALHEFITEIPLLYNVTGLGHLRGLRKEMLDTAAVLHWTGPRKPWRHDGLYRELYFDDVTLQIRSDYDVTFRRARFLALSGYAILISGLSIIKTILRRAGW